MKTYSRAEKRRYAAVEDTVPSKRRRVGDDDKTPMPKPIRFSSMSAWLQTSSATPSSDAATSDPAVFSDAVTDMDTPPSSPPPYNTANENYEPVQIKHTAISATARNNKVESLDEISGNAVMKSSSKDIKTLLVQMQINVGSALQKTCKQCGMTYLRTSAEDSALHDRFHLKDINGIDLGKAFWKAADSRAVWRGRDGFFVAVVDARDKISERRKAREVLDVAQTELGAVEITDRALWDCAPPHDDLGDREGSPRYRIFLGMSGRNCIGLCLAKRISRAWRFTGIDGNEQDPSYYESQVAIEDEDRYATIGISRIWTSKSHRQRGVARALLNSVARSFDSIRPTPMAQIAFSQPTTQGTALARRWFGAKYGWLVYIE